MFRRIIYRVRSCTFLCFLTSNHDIEIENERRRCFVTFLRLPPIFNNPVTGTVTHKINFRAQSDAMV